MRVSSKHGVNAVGSKRIGVSLPGGLAVVRKRDVTSASETAYLLGRRANAEHLRRALDQVRLGLTEEHELADEES